jgi:hypothetical protein
MDERVSVAITNAHKQAVSAPVNELAASLQQALSRRLTAYIAGVNDAKTVTRWANGEVTEIRDHLVEQKLRVAFEIFLLLMNFEASQTVRSWFIGLNPQLDDVAPAEAIREGRLKDAIAAARAFTVGG